MKGIHIVSVSVLAAAILLLPCHAGVLVLEGGDWVSFENSEGLIPVGEDPFTLEAWINPTSPTGGGAGGQITFWGEQAGNQSNGFRMRGPAGVRHYFWGNDHDEDFEDGSIIEDDTGPNGDGWHHLAFTFDGSETIWYHNGEPLGFPRAVSGVNVADSNFRIGSRLDAEFFDGFIDEVRIWNVARSEEDIAGVWETELNGDEEGLVAYFNFEDELKDVTGQHDGTAETDFVSVDADMNAPVAPAGDPDEDDDGLLDRWEETHFGNIEAQNGEGDPDGDGLNNEDEQENGTDPNEADSDADGLNDKAEIDGGLDPLDDDVDDDGLEDGVETNTGTFVSAEDTGTDPKKKDTDGDGFSDSFEINPAGGAAASDPTDPNSTPQLAGYVGAVLADNPVSYWRFEDEGTTAADIGSSGTNGEYVGVTTTPGQIGKAAKFEDDPGNSHIDFAGPGEGSMAQLTNVDNGDEDPDRKTSLEFWINTAQEGQSDDNWRTAVVFGEESPGDGDIQWGYLRPDGKIAFALNDANHRHHESEEPLNDETWHHVVITFDWTTSTSQLYVDGDFESDFEGGGNVFTDRDADIRYMGWNSRGEGGQGQFAGLLDEVAIYDKILSAQRVQAHFAAAFDDTDGGGIPDAFETPLGLNPDDPSDDTADTDGDGLNNKVEVVDLGTDHTKPDTDGDGLDDKTESEGPTDPLNADTDGDGLSDGVETNTKVFVSATDTGTDPTNPNTDGDHVKDGDEIAGGSNPLDPNDPPLPRGIGVLALDGSSIVTFENPSGMIPDEDDPFTVEAWINPTSIPTGGGNGGQILFWGEQAGNQSNGFRLRGEAGVRHYFWGNDHDEDFEEGSIIDDDTGPNEDGWHHLAFTFDGEVTNWYHNGEPLGNPRDVSGVNVADNNHRIGSRINAEFFDGFLDEIAIWNVARTAEEIEESRDLCLDPGTPGLVALWNFDGSEDNFLDVTGNGHDGTPEGDATIDLSLNAPCTGTSGTGFQITSIVFDDQTRDATVTWTSKPNRTYAISFSPDLQAWSEIDDGIESQGEQTSFTDEAVPAEDDARYYRITEF